MRMKANAGEETGKTVLHPSVRQLRFKLRFALILTELHQHDDNEAFSCQCF